MMERLAALFERLSSPRLKWSLIATALVGAAVWLTFFDSHSFLRRYRWQRELKAMTEQNRQLQREITEIEVRLEEVGSEEVIEEIAREQYGMRRPGETVYRVVRDTAAGTR